MERQFDIREKNIKVQELINNIDFTRATNDDRLIEAIENQVYQFPQFDRLNVVEKSGLIDEIFAEIKGYGLIQDYLDNDSITEIIINGTDNIIIESGGEFIYTERFFSTKEKLWETILKIASSANKTVNRLNPILDMVLKNGERVNIVMDPVSVNGPTVTIRKFTKKVITLENLFPLDTTSDKLIGLLKELVVKKKSIFVNGGTGSGKTTLLNALINEIPVNERLVIIEDSPEIKIERHRNVVRLEPRFKMKNKDENITTSDLIKTSLRMRPDRIIVGEVRADETLDMLQALNTGHNGSLSTGHGNSNEDMLYRIETLVMMYHKMSLESIRRQIVSGIDFLVSMKRYPDGIRRIECVQQLCGLSENSYILKDYARLKCDENGYSYMVHHSLIEGR